MWKHFTSILNSGSIFIISDLKKTLGKPQLLKIYIINILSPPLNPCLPKWFKRAKAAEWSSNYRNSLQTEFIQRPSKGYMGINNFEEINFNSTSTYMLSLLKVICLRCALYLVFLPISLFTSIIFHVLKEGIFLWIPNLIIIHCPRMWKLQWHWTKR